MNLRGVIIMLNLLKDFSILYAEDEPAIRSDIAEYLSSYFQCVYIASDGAEALDYYYAHRPDVLLLDINLPYISGLDVAREVRQSDDETKILILTAHSDNEKLLQATELKLTKYLLKPITPVRFKEAMQQLASELSHHSKRFDRLDGECIWDCKSKRLLHKSRPVELTDKECRLLTLLLESRTFIVSYADIMVNVWEDSFDREISLDSVKNQVSKLRKKLPENIIESVYGVGYRLR